MIRLLAVIVFLATYGGQGSELTSERLAGQPHSTQSWLGRRRSRSAPPDELPEDARAALAPALDASERIDRSVAAVGCTLVLTDRRLAVVRDGASFRPRTGVQTWPLDRELTLRLGPPRGGTSRLVIDHAGRSASAFLTTAQLDGARALIAAIRQRIYADD